MAYYNISNSEHIFIVALLLASLLLCPSSPQLVINVKNQGGDVLQEIISSNVSEDTVTLEFQRPDGILVTQLIDFTNEVQILKVLILGEEERGQSQYQVMCFVMHADKTEFISADAMAKLRQKNPGAIRSAEEDRGRSNHTMSHWISTQRAGAAALSRWIPALCAEAADAVYTSHSDIQAWSALSGFPMASVQEALKEFPLEPSTLPCSEVRNARQACRCRVETCIGWYPCGLKYCKGRGPPAAAPLSYRCGINTCRRCHHLDFYVHRKHRCLWDE